MSNKQKLIDQLKEKMSQDLTEELQHFLEVDREQGESYDIADAFRDAANLSENYASESAKDKKLWNEIKDIYIQVGYVKPVDITTVHVSSGKKYWFIKQKQHYDCVNSWEQWINE